MKRVLLLTPALALAAACSGSPTTIQPGQWETTTQMTEVEIPGMPEAMAAQMREQMGNQRSTQTHCITPEEAANPAGRMVNPGGDSQQCEFSESTFAGGVINVQGTCPSPTGGSIATSLEGTYTETTMEGRIGAEVQGGPQNMRMSGTLTSRRIGDCPT